MIHMPLMSLLHWFHVWILVENMTWICPLHQFLICSYSNTFIHIQWILQSSAMSGIISCSDPVSTCLKLEWGIHLHIHVSFWEKHLQDCSHWNTGTLTGTCLRHTSIHVYQYCLHWLAMAHLVQTGDFLNPTWRRLGLKHIFCVLHPRLSTESWPLPSLCMSIGVASAINHTETLRLSQAHLAWLTLNPQYLIGHAEGGGATVGLFSRDPEIGMECMALAYEPTCTTFQHRTHSFVMHFWYI